MLIHGFYRLLHKLLILELHHTEQPGKERSKINFTLFRTEELLLV